MNAIGQDLGDFWGSHHRAERAPVADSLGHRDDVGDDALRFKTPEMGSRPAEASLDFIRNADAASGADVLIDMFQITIGKHHHAADTLDGFGNKTRYLSRRSEVNQLLHIRGVFFSSVGIISTVRSAIRVGCEGVMETEAVRHI